MARPIQNSSKVGALVLDPFCGSGSTLLACEHLDRRGYGVEIEPQYVAVTLDRLTAIGLTPTLAETVAA